MQLLERLYNCRQKYILLPEVIPHNFHIQLDIDKRIMLDPGQVGITGAVIIQRKLEAVILQGHDLFLQHCQIDHGSFGNLQMDPVRINRILTEGL